MADDRDPFKAFQLHQACEVVDVIGEAVAGTGRPAGIAVAAQVGCYDMKIPRNACAR